MIARRDNSLGAFRPRALSREVSAFDKLMAPHRRAIHTHCYRMLGSPFDADDALQETLLAAWRAFETFEQRSALRTWLYRIATRICLRMISHRPRRLTSPDVGPARQVTADLGTPFAGQAWLEPLPTLELADPASDAETRLIENEHISLAFAAMLQHLPGNQRAILLMREVVGFSAVETAEILETTVPAVNSALQRARRTLAIRRTRTHDPLKSLGDEVETLLLEFSTAWENRDVQRMIELLARDVRFTMPPMPVWFEGRDSVSRFLVEHAFKTPWRLLPLSGNGQPGFAFYLQPEGDDRFRPAAVALLELDKGLIRAIDSFQDEAVLRRFGMADELQ